MTDKFRELITQAESIKTKLVEFKKGCQFVMVTLKAAIDENTEQQPPGWEAINAQLQGIMADLDDAFNEGLPELDALTYFKMMNQAWNSPEFHKFQQQRRDQAKTQPEPATSTQPRNPRNGVSIEDHELTDEDIGRGVVYLPKHVGGDKNHPDTELGILKRWNDVGASVAYGYDLRVTDFNDLRFITN